MKYLWIAVYGVSLLVGLAMSRLAPSRWDVSFSQALLVGSALYFAALHRCVMHHSTGTERVRWFGSGGLFVGLLIRACVFLTLAVAQALACFEWAPRADLRVGYVIAATWLFALGLIDTPSWARNGERNTVPRQAIG